MPQLSSETEVSIALLYRYAQLIIQRYESRTV